LHPESPARPFPRLLRRLLLWAASALAAGVLLLTLAAFWPLGADGLAIHPDPAASYAAARAEAARLIAQAPPGINPACRGSVLDHGRKTPDVYVLLHGLTNCPAQFRAFGEELFASGANVLIPRTPYHGYEDRMTKDQKLLTAQSMIDTASHAIDLARGYGGRVTVIGLSVNGVTAAWLAQERADVDRAVLVSPFFAPAPAPGAAIAPLTRLLMRLPNLFVWWDPGAKEELPGSQLSYPRFSTHPIAQVMRLGLDVFALAASRPPKAPAILIVTSAADTAVNNTRTAELAALWEAQAPGRVRTFAFPLDQQIPHDSIDPSQPGARTDIVYPALQKQIAAMTAKPAG
jgi:carboxylesterase